MNGSQKGEIQIRSSDLKGFEGTKKRLHMLTSRR